MGRWFITHYYQRLLVKASAKIFFFKVTGLSRWAKYLQHKTAISLILQPRCTIASSIGLDKSFYAIEKGLRPALSSLLVPSSVWSTKPKLDHTIFIVTKKKLRTITLVKYTVHASAHRDPITLGVVIAKLDHIS